MSVNNSTSFQARLDYYFTHNEREAAETKLENALNLATIAVEHEKNGNHQDAIRLWKKIFGKDFPESVEEHDKGGRSGTGIKRESKVRRHAQNARFG